jgi:peptidoglycan/xylan/chitin deacetylase (PgdA/CDA1 family)
VSDVVDLGTLFRKLRKSYLKNVQELRALKQRCYPEFVFDSALTTLHNEIPVFTLHAVVAEEFEAQLQFLKRNGYQTLVADELYDCLTKTRPIAERSIVLTFDDGWKNLWTVAFPLLKAYGFRAVCLLIPGLIRDEANAVPTFESHALCSWEEIHEMHESGVIDFQSHSMYHALVCTGERIRDFMHPGFETYAMNLDVPLYTSNGAENASRCLEWGTPIYESAPSFAGRQRYFDDEQLREHCVHYVRNNGGQNFFRQSYWRRRLREVTDEYQRTHPSRGHYEQESELRTRLYDDLVQSKQMIEKRLPGKTVRHFCYPWWIGSEIAVELSKRAGYITNFWGAVPGRRTNRAGDDPYQIPRLLSAEYIWRLPGEGNKTLVKVLAEGLIRRGQSLTRTTIAGMARAI